MVTRTVPEWALGKMDREPYALTVVLEDRSQEQVRLYTQIQWPVAPGITRSTSLLARAAARTLRWQVGSYRRYFPVDPKPQAPLEVVSSVATSTSVA